MNIIQHTIATQLSDKVIDPYTLLTTVQRALQTMKRPVLPKIPSAEDLQREILWMGAMGWIAFEDGRVCLTVAGLSARTGATV